MSYTLSICTYIQCISPMAEPCRCYCPSLRLFRPRALAIILGLSHLHLQQVDKREKLNINVSLTGRADPPALIFAHGAHPGWAIGCHERSPTLGSFGPPKGLRFFPLNGAWTCWELATSLHQRRLGRVWGERKELQLCGCLADTDTDTLAC